MRYPYDNGKYTLTTDFQPSHKALDLVANGNDEIKASANGVVTFTWNFPHNITTYDNKTLNNNGGIFVIIRSDTYNQWYYNGHMRDLNVSVGQRVNEGHVLGHQGKSGYAKSKYAGGDPSHDHFEMRIGTSWLGGTPVNPKNYIKEENNMDYKKMFEEADAARLKLLDDIHKRPDGWAARLEESNKYLKEAGDVSRDALRKMGMQTNLPDLEAVKVVASHAVGLHNSRQFIPVGELYVKK